MATAKTPSMGGPFEDLRADITEDMYAFLRLLQKMQGRYARGSKTQITLNEAGRFFLRAVDLLQANRCLEERDAQQIRFLASKVV